MTTSLRHILRTLSVTIILTILSVSLASAQATKVKGRVVDASTGEGIPFAGIYFLNSTVGSPRIWTAITFWRPGTH